MQKRDTSDIFRQRLLALIERSGLSRSQFATRAGLDRSTLSQLLSDVNVRLPRTETIARIAAGYAELERENYDQASEYFRQVGDPLITPKFFQHWFWRMTAQLGLSQVWLESGDVVKAQSEAEAFLESALSTANPYLQALAWEMKSRIAIAEQDWNGAHKYVNQALEVLEEFEVPVAAWRVHATACDLYLHAKDDKAAETHRACAEAHILAIANSFAPDEPLRQSFLAAAPVRRILSNRKTRNTSLAPGLR